MLFCILLKQSNSKLELLKIVYAVLFDLSKAFDSPSNQIFLGKFQSLHFLPSEIRIVEGFLTGRLHHVSVNGVQSEWMELKQGVSQGTVIGPLIFNLNLNDLPKHMSEAAHKLQYADDCLAFCNKIFVIKNLRLLLKYYKTFYISL